MTGGSDDSDIFIRRQEEEARLTGAGTTTFF
jgi:hypothetical protein